MANVMEDTIIALATPPGVSGIAVIRLSGKDAISLTQKLFSGKDLIDKPTHTIHFGTLQSQGKAIDEVLVSIFKEPKSFTKENVVEISCHGSAVIAKEIIKAFLQIGARLATPGEFTKRAFLNGRFDLAQAESVADLIHAETNNAHQAAFNQMRGGYSLEIKKLREELIHFASLVELELDFGEEDVEFAQREELRNLILKIQEYLQSLIRSFDQGNVIKNGVPVVIVGKPNAGKSTLLNTLLNEEKAIVSEIPGTTRDVIEDEIIIEGVSFRFIDTAGLRETQDVIEKMGVERTRGQMKKASLILYLFDIMTTSMTEMEEMRSELSSLDVPLIMVANKIDQADSNTIRIIDNQGIVGISAAFKTNVQLLKDALVNRFKTNEVKQGDVLLTNLRHYQSLMETHESLARVLEGMSNGATGDLLAMDIRQSLYHLGLITGEITTDDLLENIFSKFCIGK
jgi:tRNA modification GTPase TrmE